MGNMLNEIVFQPPRPSSYGDSLHGIQKINSQGETIALTIHKSHQHASDPILVVVSHGNAEDLGQINSSLRAFSALLGQSTPNIVVGYDYCGYGRSTGLPSELKVFGNALDAMTFAMKEFNIPANRVVVWGRSLGSGPTCYLAHYFNHVLKQPFMGIVLQSPLLSAFRVGLRSTSSWKLPFDQFCNYERVKKGLGDDTRIFVIHGMQDEVVPFAHGKTIYETIPEKNRHPPLFVPDAGHNDVEFQVSRMQTILLYSSLEAHIVAFIASMIRDK